MYNVNVLSFMFSLFYQKTLGLSHPSGSIVDGIFSCKWTRALNMPGQDLFADLHNEYYILVGNGPVSDGKYSKQNNTSAIKTVFDRY